MDENENFLMSSSGEVVPRDEMLQAFLRRMTPRETRFRYFQKRNGPWFVWTVEPFALRDESHPANGKYESVVYLPVGKGSRSGKATQWLRDESSASQHTLRKDAKARALKLYREWEAGQ